MQQGVTLTTFVCLIAAYPVEGATETRRLSETPVAFLLLLLSL